MKWIVLAGMLLASTPAAAAVEMPKALQGGWNFYNEEGIGERLPEGEWADFFIGSSWYSGVEDHCDVLEITKLSDNRYVTRAHCRDESVDEEWEEVKEFELSKDGKRLQIKDIGS